jgi:catechol 2,3-dioxygenase-like lactoylglutathione lyase family enzyme
MGSDVARVHGIGGLFFKARDPEALGAWYREHLGFDVQSWGGACFHWNRTDRAQRGYTVWSPFAEDTRYFEPSTRGFMLNLRVDDLDATLEALRAAGAQVLERREDGPNGKFGYVLDPEGLLLELWQPAPDDPEVAVAMESA